MAKKPQQSELDGHGEETGLAAVDRPTVLEERYPSGALMLRRDAPPEEWPTSLQVGSRKWRAAIVNSALTAEVEIGAEWTEVLCVKDWLVSWQEKCDPRTGEVRVIPWLSLFCADGTIIGTSSQVIPHQLARMLRAYTKEEWAEGIPVQIRRRLSRGGKTSYHEMRVCE